MISPSRTSVILGTTSGDESYQIVDVGTSCCLRSFYATYGADPKSTDRDAYGLIEYRDGDSSGDVLFKYSPPRPGRTFSGGQQGPTMMIEVPGSGIRFDNGLCIKFVFSSGDTLSIVSGIIYS
jgi:hypothetical protein